MEESALALGKSWGTICGKCVARTGPRTRVHGTFLATAVANVWYWNFHQNSPRLAAIMEKAVEQFCNLTLNL